MPDPLTDIVTPSLGVTPTAGGLLLRHGSETLDLKDTELDALVHLLTQLHPGRALTLDTCRNGPVNLQHQDGHVHLQARDFHLDCPPELHWLPYTFCFLAAYEPATPRERVLRYHLIIHCAAQLQTARQPQMAWKDPRPEPRRATPEA